MISQIHRALALVIAFSCSGLQAKDTISKTVDLRKDRTSPAQHSIILCARTSKLAGDRIGHAFVAFIAPDEKRQATVVESLGFYPADGNKGVFGTVTGKLVNEATADSSTLALTTHRLVLHVDPAAFASARQEAQRWNTTDYNLFEQNCTHMCHNVLRDLGVGFTVTSPKTGSLKAGVSPETPADYLVRLIEEIKN